MTTEITNDTRQRTRSRRSQRKTKVRPLRDPRVGSYIFAGMCLVTLAYGGAIFAQVRQSAITYAGLVPGETRSDVLYFSGVPSDVRTGSGPWQRVGPGVDPTTGDHWRYRGANGSVTEVAFDDAGEISRITCADDGAVPEACPGTLDVTLGTSEQALFNRLGAPDRQVYVGVAKVVTYTGTGLEFALRQARVYRIALSRRAGSLSYLGEVFRVLVP